MWCWGPDRSERAPFIRPPAMRIVVARGSAADVASMLARRLLSLLLVIPLAAALTGSAVAGAPERHHRIATASTRAPNTSGSAPAPITAWRAPGSQPLSDDDAASRVRPKREVRPDNTIANHYTPTALELQRFLNDERDRYGQLPADANPLLARVTGRFTGTTDEIIQWAAEKWGIPEDWVRAMAVKETYWHMSGLGDRKAVSDPLRYHAYSHIAGTSDVHQSLGIVQIKWNHPDGNNTGLGTEPLRWKSTAFNLDYALASIRFYFDGLCSWCTTGYSAGQRWKSLAAWYNPYPWNNGGQLGYIDSVKAILADRTWTRPGF